MGSLGGLIRRRPGRDPAFFSQPLYVLKNCDFRRARREKASLTPNAAPDGPETRRPRFQFQAGNRLHRAGDFRACDPYVRTRALSI